MDYDGKLSTHLKYWRIDRPSEWKMDEFIKAALALELNTNNLKCCGNCKIYCSYKNKGDVCNKWEYDGLTYQERLK